MFVRPKTVVDGAAQLKALSVRLQGSANKAYFAMQAQSVSAAPSATGFSVAQLASTVGRPQWGDTVRKAIVGASAPGGSGLAPLREVMDQAAHSIRTGLPAGQRVLEKAGESMRTTSEASALEWVTRVETLTQGADARELVSNASLWQWPHGGRDVLSLFVSHAEDVVAKRIQAGINTLPADMHWNMRSSLVSSNGRSGMAEREVAAHSASTVATAAMVHLRTTLTPSEADAAIKRFTDAIESAGRWS